MRVERFEYKLGGMRKADEFIVYPRSRFDDGSFLVQGDRSIARVMPDGSGFLNWKGSTPKYGPHLSPALGAEKVDQFPAEFVGMVRNYCPSSGDEVGPGITLV